MTTQSISPTNWRSPAFANKALNGSMRILFTTILVGQAIFSYYIVSFYYGATIHNNLKQFNEVLSAGYIEGDFWGNVAVIGHVLFAAIITVGGLLQLFPFIRNNIPSLHRWNGRLYILTAIIISLSGAFMIFTRHDQVTGDWFGHITLMINGVIILACAVLAFRFARQKQFAQHRIWALRLFVAVSGVWFFRVGLMGWLVIHGKPVGFDPVTFSGPLLMMLNILVYILPLLFLEVYFRAQSGGSVNKKLLTASGVLLLSILMSVGVFGATMGFWLPRI